MLKKNSNPEITKLPKKILKESQRIFHNMSLLLYFDVNLP